MIISKIAFADPGTTTDTPWDTLVAKLQVIESMNKPDSVKTGLTQKLFSDYNLKAEDYKKFYTKLLQKPPEEQLEFLKKVENIILEFIKQNQIMKR